MHKYNFWGKIAIYTVKDNKSCQELEEGTNLILIVKEGQYKQDAFKRGSKEYM